MKACKQIKGPSGKDTFIFRMVTLDSSLNDANFMETAKAFPADLSEHVFNMKPVRFISATIVLTWKR